MKNILITCAGGAGSLYLAESLQNTFQVFLANGNDQVAACHFDFPFTCVPLGSDPSYQDAIRKLIEEWNIDYVVPGADEELISISSLQEEGTVIGIIPNKSFIETCLNKKKLMQVLHEHNISSLLPFTEEQKVSYPAFAKPVYGRGSRQAHLIDTKSQLDGYLKLYDATFSEVLVQPYIGGEEYTVSVIVNNKNRIIGIVPKRIIEKRGITQAAVTESNTEIEKVCTRIVEEMNPCGPFNVQLKLHDGVCSIFEINPRLSTTAVLTDKAFGNETELCIRYYNQTDLSSLPTMEEGVHMYRHQDHCFVTQ